MLAPLFLVALTAVAYALGGALWGVIAFLAVAVVRLAQQNLALRRDTEGLLARLPPELHPSTMADLHEIQEHARSEDRASSDRNEHPASQPDMDHKASEA